MEKKLYKLNAAGVQSLKDRGTSYAQNMLDVLKNGENHFTIESLDDDGNVMSIKRDGSLFRAGQQTFSGVWCLFMSHDKRKYIEPVNPETGEAEIPQQNFWVMTIPTTKGQAPFCIGPYSEAEAETKAQAQIRNATDGVRVHVVRSVSEAFLKTVVEKV